MTGIGSTAAGQTPSTRQSGSGARVSRATAKATHEAEDLIPRDGCRRSSILAVPPCLSVLGPSSCPEPDVA